MNGGKINKSIVAMECRVCGASEFEYRPVLWPGLISEWQLSSHEVEYINWQQGCFCVGCGNNLRSIALADAICRSLGFSGPLSQIKNCTKFRELRVLEINPAGGLTKFLEGFQGHRLVNYPEYDMCDLALDSQAFDLVVHSDTLEHVPNPQRGLSECRRILRDGGACIYTVPIVVDRLTRSRAGLSPSFHGRAEVVSGDQLVHTEFGADFWKSVIQAGFKQCILHVFDYPAAMAVIARG
ncbi:MAG: class I SAM-dependent methyltransferase [Ketobacter sp.]|nr:MAG: class I SAM-dependent methyltransferase [Ketobacter sp.]